MLINVLDYPDVATAIAAANDGDRIYFPGVRNYDAPLAGWRITKSVEIFGDGASPAGSALRAAPNATEAMFVLDPGTETELPHVSFRDLLLTSPTPNVRVGLQGIRFASESGKKLSELRLERVRISWLGDTGLQLHGTNAEGGAIVGVGLFDCEFANCGQQGVSLSIAYAVQAIRCTFRNNQLQGLRTRGEELALYGCLFEDNCLGGGDAQLSGYDDAFSPGQLEICRVDACVFRRVAASQPFVGLRLRRFDGGMCVGGCSFEEPAGAVGGVGMQFASVTLDTRGSAVVLPNRFKNLATAIAVDSAVALKGAVIFPQFCDPLTATIQLPSSVNDAPVGSPSANSQSANAHSGLLVPAYGFDPASNLQTGMLAYNASADPNSGKHLRILLTDPGSGALTWKNIQTA